MPLAPVMVTGVGRCGTSMIAGVLTELGFDMGLSVPSDEHNPSGYYEDYEFVYIHEGLLQETFGWDVARTGIMRLIEARIKKGKPWGVKDPRLCYFMAFYASLIPYARWIVCTRNVEQTIRSYQATYRMERDDCLMIMQNRWDALHVGFNTSPGLMCLHMNFERILESPEKAINAIRIYLGLGHDPARDAQARSHIKKRTPEMSREILPPTDIHKLKVIEQSIPVTA